jgi:hypothetical protein
MTRALPFTIISAYRLLPARWRKFGGKPSSHLALADIARGVNGWRAIAHHANPHLFSAKVPWDNPPMP